METSGSFGDTVDNWLGIPHHVLDQLSLRDQRKIVKNRAQLLIQERNSITFQNQVPLTKPVAVGSRGSNGPKRHSINKSPFDSIDDQSFIEDSTQVDRNHKQPSVFTLPSISLDDSLSKT
jgi:hypothetical protein